MAERGARAYSIRRRLLLALLGALACVWVAMAAFSYFDARHEVNDLLDAHLAQSASLLVAQAGNEFEEIDLDHAPQLHERARKVAFQIWERGRLLRLHSASAPSERLSSREEGFSNTRIAGKEWRVFSSWDTRRHYLVQVGERTEARREIAEHIARNLLVPLLLALPFLGFLVWWSITRALQPLGLLGSEVAGRAADDLRPLSSAGVPREAAPLVAGLNALFVRVGSLIENERRFTADAAHELRTPLAALKAQAQVARGAGGGAERDRALDKVVAACDRAARLVEQLLTLARLAQGPEGGLMQRFDLRALARDVAAELAPVAIAKSIELELAPGGPAPISGHPGLVGVLLRNLIDNAVRYSPAHSVVCLDVAVDGQRCVVRVMDEGPGIAPAERDKVGRRFYRILGSGESGSGLGLSIVKRIAALHRATVALEPCAGGKGLCVRISFPA